MGVFLTFAKWSLQIGGVNGSIGVRSRVLCVYACTCSAYVFSTLISGMCVRVRV